MRQNQKKNTHRLFPTDLDPAEAKKQVAAAKKNGAAEKQKKDPSVLGLLTGGGPNPADASNFDILASLVSSSGDLADKIKSAEKVTVFAPNDAAFIQTARDLGFSGPASGESLETAALQYIKDGFTPADLQKTVEYHVVEDDLSSAQVLRTTSISTLAGEDISRTAAKPTVLEDKAGKLTDPKLRENGLDQRADNGRVHQIDRVLFPVAASKEGVSKAVAATRAAAGEDSEASDTKSDPSPSAPADSDEGSPCFPASALVHLANGSDVPMHALTPGDAVRFTTSPAVAHPDAHSPVYFFSHRQHSGAHTYVRIETDAGHALTLSAGHYLYANSRLTAADRVRPGDALDTLDGAARVVAARATRARGRVAPHTLHGDIVVDRVRASTYTRAVRPALAHALLAPVRAAVRAGLAVEPLGRLFYNGADGIARYAPKGH